MDVKTLIYVIIVFNTVLLSKVLIVISGGTGRCDLLTQF
jgi:hypothetical protein